MAKCAFCGKETSFGKQLSITRSHISKRTTRTVKPNLRTVKTLINGEPKRKVLEKYKNLIFLQHFYFS